MSSISRLPSSSAFNYASRSASSASESKKFGAASPTEQSGQPQGMEELMKLIQQLMKALGKDGFEDSAKGAGGAGGGKSGGCGGGGGGQGGGAGGVGGVDAASEGLTPMELGADPASGPKSFSGAGNADAVAQQIAQDATGWNYDRSAGKSFDEAVSKENAFDASKSGICTDMAVEAAQRFEAAGIDARLVGGETNKGNHAWVEYKGDDGQWKRFDPTAAATSKDASTALNTESNAYQYGRIIETRDDVPAEVASI